MTRYFIGLMAPNFIANYIWGEYAQVRETSPRATDWVVPSDMHVTLQFMGEATRGPLEDAMRAAAAGLAPTRVTIDRAPHWLGRHLVHGVDGADALASTLRGLLPPVDTRPFHGHLTIGKLPAGGTTLLAPTIDEVTWVADRLQLVESAGGAARPRYRVVAEARLDA